LGQTLSLPIQELEFLIVLYKDSSAYYLCRPAVTHPPATSADECDSKVFGCRDHANFCAKVRQNA
jgi:hypothetical protein